MFTASATRNRQGAAVGVVVKCALLQNFVSVTKITDRIIHALFKGKPETRVVSCYSPTNVSDEKDVAEFYESLNQTVLHIPLHTCLVIGGDFNTQVSNCFSYHSNTNRDGQLILDCIHEHNLLMTNTPFCKPKSRLWTFRAPNKFKSQIDFILCQKRWRNSIMDSQAHSSSDSIGSDHRIVCAKLSLSVTTKKHPPKSRLNWDAITTNRVAASRIENQISSDWEALERTQINSYKVYVEICNKAGSATLPPRVAFKTSVCHTNEVNAVRKVVISAQPEKVSTAQTTLRQTYDETQEKHYYDILRAFDSCESTNALHNAWKLVKQLSGKKPKTIFTEGGAGCLDAWKTYFKQLLSSDNTRTPIQKEMRPDYS